MYQVLVGKGEVSHTFSGFKSQKLLSMDADSEDIMLPLIVSGKFGPHMVVAVGPFPPDRKSCVCVCVSYDWVLLLVSLLRHVLSLRHVL